MRRVLLSGLLALAVGLAGCASRRDPAVGTSGSNDDRLTSATVTFASLQDGKDAKSGVTVQVVRSANELAAEGSSSGTEFDDNSTAPPIALSLKGPFSRGDAQTGQLRLRLTPDGDDTWTFNVRLALRFADETQQDYAWSAIRLDEKAPERTLVLAGARVP
jgi:hypothetical protein